LDRSISKGSKSRVIPLHESTTLALRHYASTRDSIYVKRSSPAFFVWEGGNRLIYDSVNRWFLLVACQIGLRKPGNARGPRVHDLRHYFAIRRRDRMLLLVALQTGLRVSELMPTQTTWVDPELFLERCCVKVFYTYKDDDIDQGPNRFWFTLNPECSVERPSCGSEFCPHVFDVRELSSWQPPVQPPYCTGENNTAENQAAGERYPFLPRLNSHY